MSPNLCPMAFWTPCLLINNKLLETHHIKFTKHKIILEATDQVLSSLNHLCYVLEQLVTIS